MTRRPLLSRSETEVARVVWELGEATVRQAHEAIPAKRKIEFASVQTYLRRLESKGYLHARLEGRTSIYTPRVKPATVIRETVDDLVERLFAGETLPLVQHLIEDRGISEDELAQLRKWLDAHEEENG